MQQKMPSNRCSLNRNPTDQVYRPSNFAFLPFAAIAADTERLEKTAKIAKANEKAAAKEKTDKENLQ